MEVELVDYTQEPETKIASFAAVCYDSDAGDPDKLERRIKHLMKVRHLATLRFAYATFYIGGISRGCSHQLVRSKHLDFLQRSQRYVKEHGAGHVIPASLEKSSTYRDAMASAKRSYQMLLASGVRAEDARFVLPNAIETELYAVGNFQAWVDFLRLRLDKKAQWEIRAVAQEIAAQLALIAPNIFMQFLPEE